jgi:hypothetical protein
MSVVDQSVKDGIGQRGVADRGISVLDRKLAGHGFREKWQKKRERREARRAAAQPTPEDQAE